MLLTRKIRITPTAAQAQVLWALSEKCRLLYNFALTERRQHWTVNRAKPSATPCERGATAGLLVWLASTHSSTSGS